MSTVVPERGASLRLLIWMPLAAAGLLAALITGRPELAILAGPFAVTLVAGAAMVSRPEFTCRLDIDADRVLQGDTVQANVRLTSSVNLPRVEVLLGLPSGLSVVERDRNRDQDRDNSPRNGAQPHRRRPSRAAGPTEPTEPTRPT